MKVLLVKPYNLSDHIQPSLGLGYLATAIRSRHDVKILDCIKENVNIDALEGRIRGYSPDVVGIQCYTFDLKFIGAALRLVKSVNKHIVTVIGGPHPSAVPEDTLKRFGGYLDYLFVAEAESGFPELLDHLAGPGGDLSSIPGLGRADNGQIIINEQKLTEDLDSLGLPAWDLIHPETYPESQHGAFFKQFPIAPIMVTRGCPYPCTFCAGSLVSGKKIRRRGIEHVLNELIYLKDNFGIREFHVIDDNFTMDTNYAKELLRRLKRMKLGMTWSVPNGVRMDTLDEELLQLMKDTGLYMISLGIESGSDEVLKAMKKGITAQKIRECVGRIDKAGIDMAGFFILGFPGETEESIRRTIDLSTKLPIKRANFFTYLPFPGSESYRKLEKSGELKGVDWEKFYFMNAAYVPPALNRKRLKKLHRLAFARFYLRPGIIFYQIRSIRSFRHLLFLMRRFFRWIVMG
jgi:radical SAM superfamily enzyme YgiQ (UPF0313 family)